MSPQDLLELRQLELRVMAQELAVLAAQIRTADHATRAVQDAQRREWELRLEQQAQDPWGSWAPFALGAATGVALGLTLLSISRPRSY